MRGRKKSWQVYMVRCRDGTLYTGVTRDLARRLKEHNGAGGRGAKYTRGRGPVRLVYKERAADRSRALKREAALKRLSQKEKRALIRGRGGGGHDGALSGA